MDGGEGGTSPAIGPVYGYPVPMVVGAPVITFPPRVVCPIAGRGRSPCRLPSAGRRRSVGRLRGSGRGSAESGTSWASQYATRFGPSRRSSSVACRLTGDRSG